MPRHVPSIHFTFAISAGVKSVRGLITGDGVELEDAVEVVLFCALPLQHPADPKTTNDRAIAKVIRYGFIISRNPPEL
jgi:hypothetical protein